MIRNQIGAMSYNRKCNHEASGITFVPAGIFSLPHGCQRLAGKSIPGSTQTQPNNFFNESLRTLGIVLRADVNKRARRIDQLKTEQSLIIYKSLYTIHVAVNY